MLRDDSCCVRAFRAARQSAVPVAPKMRLPLAAQLRRSRRRSGQALHAPARGCRFCPRCRLLAEGETFCKWGNLAISKLVGVPITKLPDCKITKSDEIQNIRDDDQ